MEYTTGRLTLIFIVAIALSAAGAWVLAWRFRVGMCRLMRAPVRPPAAPAGAAPARPPRPAAPPAAVTLEDNARAGLRLATLLVGLSLLLSITSAALELAVVGDSRLTVGRLLLLAFVYFWPVIPALGLVWRWSRWRVAAAMAGWFVLSFAIAWWRSSEAQDTGQLAELLGLALGPPLVLVGLLCLGSTTRAITPWLLPPMVALVWASSAGLDLLRWLLDRRPGWFDALPAWVSEPAVFAGFVAAPWLVAWWPLRRFGRALAAAYARRRLSELLVLFTAVWGIVLLYRALMAGDELGAGAAVMLLPLAWIPVVVTLARRPATDAERPPTLLVLRVFQRDRAVRRLFDVVIERWRLSGNTLLIAGTDLAERTIDGDDLFTFLDGRLPARFIRSTADIAARLDAFYLQPDAEGRYRINECYCHDTTWRDTFAALVRMSDIVLMDLRSFQARNEGCRHELGVLARAPGIARVVLLADPHTDRAAAYAATAGAPPGRFHWIDASRIDRAKCREVLGELFAPPAPQPAARPAALA